MNSRWTRLSPSTGLHHDHSGRQSSHLRPQRRGSAPRQAREWWEGLLNGRTPVGLSWLTIAGFIRLMTHPRIPGGSARCRLVPGPCAHLARAAPGAHRPARFQVRTTLPGLRRGFSARAGNLTTDAQLAALAVEHQAELHSNDSDFARFDGLRWRNPFERRLMNCFAFSNLILNGPFPSPHRRHWPGRHLPGWAHQPGDV